MATLTDPDFQQIFRLIQQDAATKQTFKTWSLSKSTWRALFQASEDWFVGAFNTTPATSYKGALDAVTTTTIAQAKAVGKIWFAWRIGITW